MKFLILDHQVADIKEELHQEQLILEVVEEDLHMFKQLLEQQVRVVQV